MQISNIRFKKNKKEVRLTGMVTFATGKTTELYFATKPKYSNFIRQDASPFLACLLLPAMKLKEDIYIDSKVSPKLLLNIRKIIKVVSKWNIGLSPIKIAAASKINYHKEGENAASFFSGGVDSFATYLRNKVLSKNKVNYLLLIHGFDIFISDENTFQKVNKSIKNVAKQEKVQLIVIKTNLRKAIDPILDWGISHGGALASVALFLSNGFGKIYIPSSYSTGHLFPWGSHPDLDHLWSIEKLKIIHDSSHLSRQQKINLYISKSPIALRYLRVCWSNYKYNCGRCCKCIRTMLALHITNSLHKSKTFPTELKPEQIKSLYLTSKSEIVFFQELLAELRKKKMDKDLQEAIEYVFMRSKKPDFKKRTRNIVSLLDRKFNNNRLFWYLAKKGITSV